MVATETLNSIIFLLAVSSVLIYGYKWVGAAGPPKRKAIREEITAADHQQISVNVAILYATLMLVIGSVVSQWPPEGQTLNPIFEDVIFYTSVFISAVIVGRVAKFIITLESKLYQ